MLSIVIPCYNEHARLPATVEAIKRYMADHHIEYELILADDGSRDATPDVIAAAMRDSPQVRTVRLPQNRGKGRALAEGVGVTRGERVLLTDADLSTPIDELPKLEAALAAGAGAAIASRSIRGSRVEISQPLYRVAMGKTFNLIVQALLLPGIWDTQCGFKLLRGDLARAVFAELVTDGFGYDPEALFLAKRRHERIVEVPVVWRNSAPTTVSAIRHSLDMFKDIIRTRFRRYPPPS